MKKEPTWTVYCHTHVASGRRYVGLTKKTMLQRWNQHVYSASRKDGKGCAHFWAAIRKYGKDAFEHQILQVCGTLAAANAAEEKLIEELGTRDPLRGFNLIRGGGSSPLPGSRYEKLSKASIDMWSRLEYRQKQELLSDSKRTLPGLSIGADKLRSRTHCNNGHEFSEENTRIHIRRGTTHQIRVCLACQRDRHVRSANNMTEARVESRRIQIRDCMRKKRARQSLGS